MNKFYLLILSLFVAIGFNAKAADELYIYGDFDGSGWKYYPLNYERDNQNDRDHYYNQIKVTGNASTIEFLVFKNDTEGNGAWYRWKYINGSHPGDDYTSVKTENGVDHQAHFQVDLSGGGSNFKIIDVQKNAVYYFDFYVKFNDDRLEVKKNSSTNQNPVSSVTPTKKKLSGDFYFYGDMNRWSLLQNEGRTVSISKLRGGEYNDTEKEKIWGKNHNNWPTYYKEDELKSIWKFKPITNEMVQKGILKEGVEFPADLELDDYWYYLDFEDISDQGVHTGILCGQFKITQGYYDDRESGKYKELNWGISGEYSTSYFGNTLKVGEVTEIEHRSGLQNMVLDNNYVENAIIYFNPTYDKIYIDGKGKDLYVYYAVVGENVPADAKNKIKWEMSDLSQQNYYVNTIGFNGKKNNEVLNGDGGEITESDSKFIEIGGNRTNPEAEAGRFVWENAPEAIKYYNTTFEPGNVIRRRIPSGATHRYPIQINVNFTDEKGNVYPKQRVLCEDLWFIRNDKEVNLHFRYDTKEATNSLDWVCYNAFSEHINNDGAVDGYKYLFGDYVDLSEDQPSITNGEWGTMKLETIEDKESIHYGEEWWSTPVALPSDFTTGAWAMFADSRGGIYPAERVEAQGKALEEMVIAGNDVWYEAATFENPSILYSHLNGTFNLQRSTGNTVQINAEMFKPESLKGDNPSYDLISDITKVKYRYEIYRNGHLVACNGTDNDKSVMYTGTSVTSHLNEFTSLPYFDWYIDGPNKTTGFEQVCMNFDNIPEASRPKSVNGASEKAGYYFIIVKCLYNGIIYTAQDTYAIYDAKPLNSQQ